MSTRTVLRPYTSSLNMASTVNTSATVLQGLSMVSYAIAWTGTSPTGTLALEISNDYALDPNGQIANAGTWNIAPINVNGALQTSVSISGNSGNGFFDVTATGAYACRLLYTASGGTGTMTITVAGKVA